jgi:hypothetical protein
MRKILVGRDRREEREGSRLLFYSPAVAQYTSAHALRWLQLLHASNNDMRM